MFKTVLVPLDGSPLAAKALPYAERLAKESEAKLILVRAVEPWGTTGGRRHEHDGDALPRAEADLQSLATELSNRGIKSETHVCVDEPASAIDGVARRTQADVIVMSTHGRGGLARWAYGSVAERVLRSSELPLLLVSAHSQRDWAVPSVGPVVVPLDGSPLAEEALAPAEGLAAILGTGLLLLQVVEPPTAAFYGAAPGAVFPLGDLDQWLEEAKKYLHGVADRYETGPIPVRAEALIGYAAAGVAEVAAHHNAAAIAITTHGRTGLARLALGSVTLGVVQRVEAPILVVRSHRVAEPSTGGNG